jgi:hypothetical protein
MQGRFCKKVLRLPPRTVNVAAEYEFRRERRRGRVFSGIAKFWCRILQMEQAEMLKWCYDWQIVNVKWDSWTANLKREVRMYLAKWKRMRYKSNMSNDFQ